MGEKIIEIKNLIFDYSKEIFDEKDELHKKIVTKRALDNVSFNVYRGEFLAVAGSNGSGKSTLAKCINALLLPTKGDIYIKGLNTKDENLAWDIRQTASVVFQNPDNQIVATIVEDDVAFGPENLGIPSEKIRDRVDESLKCVGMYEYKDKAPHLLSGGQKQKIAIAGIVAMEPEVIVFDEPTAMLDPKSRNEIMKIIKKLCKEGTTVVLITHFMEEVVCADRVVVLDNGKLLLNDTPSKVFNSSEVIKKAHLEIPFILQLKNKLKEKGIDISDEIIDKEAMENNLCQLKSRT